MEGEDYKHKAANKIGKKQQKENVSGYLDKFANPVENAKLSSTASLFYDPREAKNSRNTKQSVNYRTEIRDVKTGINNFQIKFMDTYKIYLPSNLPMNSRYAKEISFKSPMAIKKGITLKSYQDEVPNSN